MEADSRLPKTDPTTSRARSTGRRGDAAWFEWIAGERAALILRYRIRAKLVPAYRASVERWLAEEGNR